ncbi:unnamed protein product [Lymnaea stagnalis]|uniref:Ig-like domain-containing protein n=1 Tax=Lymnaea stagnalis TaxID=6523 RepID=A0AAV2IA87_LYMST
MNFVKSTRWFVTFTLIGLFGHTGLVESGPLDVTVPEVAPVVSIGNSTVPNEGTHSLTLPDRTLNTTIYLKCKVPGGRLPVSNVTLSCDFGRGARNKTVQGNSATFGLKLYGTGSANCSCTAGHASGLYHKVTKFALNYTAVPYPPEAAPLVKVGSLVLADKDTLTLKLNATSAKVSVVCSVPGGYPRVSNVTLTCGAKKATIGRSQAAFTVTYRKEMSGKSCACGGDHVTGNYNRTSSFILSVQ